MTLELSFFDALCATAVFIINGVVAYSSDFVEKYDRDKANAEDYGCGNMCATGIAPTPEVLNKYSITSDEYVVVVSQLEEGLSFGCCGWCV